VYNKNKIGKCVMFPSFWLNDTSCLKWDWNRYNRRLQQPLWYEPSAQYSTIVEKDEYLLISIDCPGVKKDDIDIVIKNDMITITTIRYDNGEKFTSSYKVSKKYNTSKISTSLSDRILTIIVGE
jgi:HSP20 family molecular chaperone IbpA